MKGRVLRSGKRQLQKTSGGLYARRILALSINSSIPRLTTIFLAIG